MPRVRPFRGLALTGAAGPENEKEVRPKGRSLGAALPPARGIEAEGRKHAYGGVPFTRARSGVSRTRPKTQKMTRARAMMLARLARKAIALCSTIQFSTNRMRPPCISHHVVLTFSLRS